MGNTSSTGGVLSPIGALPLDDFALDAVFQSLAVGITGMPGNLVRPRWQMASDIAGGFGGLPKQPEPGTDWCAIGVVSVKQSDGPWLVYDAPSNTELYWDHEELTVLVSMYGPDCQSNMRLLRAGLNVPQNTESLLPNMIRYVGCGPIRTVPELVNQQWVRRQDISLDFRRKVIMTYGVENLLISEINLIDDTYGVNDVIIVPPGSPVEP
jgi:hypothetical protein